MLSDTITDRIFLEDAPAIPGLTFRHFHGESDYPAMLATINAAKSADQEERADTLEEMINNYAHLSNCDPYQDLLIAEVDGQMVAYTRLWWWHEEKTGSYFYTSIGFMRPEYRRKGLGRAMLRHNQRRQREIAASHPQEVQHIFEVFTPHAQVGCKALLEHEGYQPARSFYFMVRPDLENIPDLPLPPGLEVRPALPEHYRQIWNAFQEAFQDHWGYATPDEDEFQGYQGSKEFQPQLWQVAWDGDQVAGMILNFINHEENQEYGRKRGYTEGIAVRRPWRRQGLARALLARSLRMHRNLGMTEAALGVDSESLSSANVLYESMGFRVVQTSTNFRKPM